MSCIICAGVPGVKPVIVELTDFKTKEKVDELEVDAVLVATGRAPYTQVDPNRRELWALSFQDLWAFRCIRLLLQNVSTTRSFCCPQAQSGP